MRSTNTKNAADLSPAAMHLLRTFSEHANRNILHPLDTERLDGVIIQAHRDAARAGASDIEEWLLDDGWPADMAENVAVAYERGRLLLRHAGV